MTARPQNVEDMLVQLEDNSRRELDLVRTLADAIRRVDDQVLRDIRSVTLQHEIRRQTIFAELQNLASQLCSLPARNVQAAIEQQPHGHSRVAIEAAHSSAHSNGGGDWRRAAQNIDEELEFTFNGHGASH